MELKRSQHGHCDETIADYYLDTYHAVYQEQLSTYL